MARIAKIAAAALLLLSAAACEHDKVYPVEGHAEWVTADGMPIPNVVDFGPVRVDTRAKATATLANLGLGTLKVASIEAPDGFPASVRFRIDQTTLERGDRSPLELTFQPTGPEEFNARLVFKLLNAAEPDIALVVRGRGVEGGCKVEPAEQLDFGSVPVGERHSAYVKVSNPSELPWTVALAALKSTVDGAAFAFPTVRPGEHVVPAHSELVIPVEFRPNHPGTHTAELEIPAPAMCQRTITLAGNGLDQVLDCEPKLMDVCRVDFGYVNPGTRATSHFVLRNLGNVEVRVSGFKVQPSTYLVRTTASELTIPSGGSVEVPVEFAPTTLGRQPGSVAFTVFSTRETTAAVELSGIGGGPDVEVQPASLDFGTVGVGGGLTRRISLANAGVNVAGTKDDNLKLGLLVDGQWVDRVPEIAPAGSAEFTILGFTSKYDPAGIEAPSSIDLQVRFTPGAAGPREAKLVVFSNDPDEGRIEIDLRGRGENMPPCEYEVLPPRLPFGMIEPGHGRTLPFTFVNKSADPADSCMIYDVELADGTNAAFSFADAAPNHVVVPGGARLAIPIRFAASEPGSYVGAVNVLTSSTAAPEARVQLSATVQTSCVMVTPADLDFGTSRLNCTTNIKEVTVYNTCTTPVQVNSMDVQGFASGFIVQKPPLPIALQPGKLMVVKMGFRATSELDENGLLLIGTQLPDAYVVSMTGRGSMQGSQTDIFAQESRPKVDTLLIVDNSGSMADKQAALGQNFQSLIRYADAQRVDYHIAVTTTAVDVAHGNTTSTTSPPDENGRLVPLAATGPRVITPATPNAEQVFMQNVNVGTSGNAREMLLRPAYLALTNPLLTGHNGGFLRDDAVLSVVVVSDGADQDNASLAFYESFLMNLKGPNRRNQVSFSAVIPTMATPPAGCDYDDQSSSTRVRDVVTATGGVVEEICTDNWAKTLQRLGDRVWGLRTKFFLSNPVDLGYPVEVSVDGANYVPGRWTYDSRENAITFDPVAVPEAGATIAVTYRIACH